MRAYWTSEDGALTLYRGDCRAVLAQMEPESVSACITSPPFWALRKYECEPTVWGGDPDCPHRLRQASDSEGADVAGGYSGKRKWQQKGISRQETPEAWVNESKQAETSKVHWQQAENGPGLSSGVSQTRHRESRASIEAERSFETTSTATCSLCGAWRGWYGLEPAVGAYVEHTIEVMRAIRRVLRDDGVLWWDIDDSRGGSGKGHGATDHGKLGGEEIARALPGPTREMAKSLCLIPQRIAIAAQEDGWIVRSVITIPTWMPESARDRPTDAYRTLLMLCKNKKYWYDGFAVRVRQADATAGRAAYAFSDRYAEGAVDVAGYRGGFFQDDWQPDGTRNLGSVWSDIPPANYPLRHFAVMPLKEAERAILASVPPEVCRSCGLARVRVVEKENVREHPQREGRKDRNKADYDGEDYAVRESGLGLTWEDRTTGWSTCPCADYEPGVVLDPFSGTGTTLLAAQKLGRRAIGIELSEEYLQQAMTRLTVGDVGLRQLVKARRDGSEQGVLL